MRRPACLLLAATLVAGAGCGTVTVTSNDLTARLYAGGRMLGRGTGELQRRGTPEKTTIIAVSEDGRRAQTVVKREFTGVTLLGGLLTYGICLIACWEYPSVVLVAFPPLAPYQDAFGQAYEPPHEQGAYGSAWGNDPWMQPPPGWQSNTGQAQPESPSVGTAPATPPAPATGSPQAQPGASAPAKPAESAPR